MGCSKRLWRAAICGSGGSVCLFRTVGEMEVKKLSIMTIFFDNRIPGNGCSRIVRWKLL